METTLQRSGSAPGYENRTGKSPRKRPGWVTFLGYLALLLFWAGLVGAGIYYAMNYTAQIKEEIVLELSRQNQEQVQALQTEYENQIAEMKGTFAADMAVLQSKMDEFNQLLAFTRDSTSDRTDNSNQLYSQLQQVRVQLDQLKKELDLLK